MSKIALLRQTFIAAFALNVSAFPGHAQQSSTTCATPKLIWSDEFEGDQLDTSKWEAQIGDGCAQHLCGWGNRELQYYRAENAQVSEGTLKITAKRERAGSKEYTSARLRTASRPASGERTHGRFEARIKLPEGAGLWPAFWMLPSNPNAGWPMSGEIDIMEAVGQSPQEVLGTIHYGKSVAGKGHTSKTLKKKQGAWTDKSHVYAVEWTPNKIRWFVDDQLYSTLTPKDLDDPSNWPFEKYRYHLILNLAIGGTLGADVDDSVFPQAMEVDYVRVYEIGQCKDETG